MKCPKCGGAKQRITDSRQTGNEVRRRRECRACGHRFTTYELTEIDRAKLEKMQRS